MREFKKQNSITLQDDDLVKIYFKQICRYPLLTAEQEVLLAIKVMAGDQEAINKMVVSNLRFVVSVAKFYSRHKFSLADLISAGNRGLVVAATKFDHKRRQRFISYAVWWIRHYMLAAITEHCHMIRLPGNQVSVILNVYRAEIEIGKTLNRLPTIAEVAEYTRLSEEKVRLAYLGDLHTDYLCNSDTQIDGLSLLDTIESTTFMAIDLILEKEDMGRMLRLALRRLPGRRGEILRLYYGLDRICAMTIYEISKHLGLSVQSVQENKTKGIATLRSKAEYGILRTFYEK